MPRDFESDPLNYTGYENKKYKTTLLQLAFRQPEEYFKLQSEVLAGLLENNIKNIYKTVFNALKDGKAADGTTALVATDATAFPTYNSIVGVNDGWQPKIPEEDCDAIAKDITKKLAELLEEKVVHLVLPPNIFDETLQRAAKKASVR